MRLTYALIDQWMASYRHEPEAVVLDIDDSVDIVHGGQQLFLFNAYCDERCFLPIHVYDSLYCARGQAENLIKFHKTQLAADRTSCRSPLANQVRLVLYTATYWLMLAVRDAIPKIQGLAKAEFKTLRLRLPKIAARITETKSRMRIAFASACSDAALFRGLATALQRGGP